MSMPAALRPLADEPLTEDERERFLLLLRSSPRLGNKMALRQVGVRATKGEIEDLFAVDADLEDDVLEARGRPVEKVVAALYQTATDPDSPSQTRAAGMYLARYGDPGWRRALARVQVEHSGPDGRPLEVNHPDVTAAIERFTAAIVRAAERSRAELPAGGPAGMGAGEPGLPVARLDSAA